MSETRTSPSGIPRLLLTLTPLQSVRKLSQSRIKPKSDKIVDAQDEKAVFAILRAAGFSDEDAFQEELKKCVKTGTDARVVELDLSGCIQLEELPPEIATLSELRTLNLSSCPVHKLSRKVGQLKQLTQLILKGCRQLTKITSEIRHLSNLEEIDLSDCQLLAAIPPEIGHLVQLQQLRLRHCVRFVALPPEIGQLEQLKVLSLHGCEQVTALPREISRFKQLEVLDLSFCKRLEALPPEIGQVTNLTSLDLTETRIQQLPPEIGMLSHQLSELNLCYCLQLKALPPEIGQLSQLRALDLTSCDQLSALPPEIGRLSHLDSLLLRSCERLTVLPPEIGNLKMLSKLDLWGCSQLLALPPEIGALSQLTALNLCFLTSLSQLPPEIFSGLCELQKLKIEFCAGLKALPPELGELSQLQKLFIIGCPLLSDLPPEIGHLKKLTTLNLIDLVELKALPPEIATLPHLTDIYISSCDNLCIPPKECHSSSEEVMSFMRDLLILRNKPLKALKKIRQDPRLLFAASQDPSYASALGKVFQADQSLAELCDDLNRTALDQACEECERTMRAAKVFYWRYDLDDVPIYESATCQVFFAKDLVLEEEGGEKPVALKFMYNNEHFAAELDARNDEQGNSRFDEKYVITALHHHDSDKDKTFGEAVEKRNVPKYCLVLEQGERNLHEAIHAENLSCNIDRVRPILQELAQCLNHLHSEGYVHGDFKPKNIVREKTSRRLQVIDFDSAVKIGEPMGIKVSTEYVPPEMILTRKGQRLLRALCVLPDFSTPSNSMHPPPGTPCLETSSLLTEADVLKAHESFDVWSFGVVMFLLVVGKPIIDGADTHDNLDANGLAELGDWNEAALNRKLLVVEDLHARHLLQDLLHPDPQQRPSMEDVLQSDFFVKAS